MNLADDRKASCIFYSQVKSVGGSWRLMSFMTSLRRSSSGESVLTGLILSGVYL